MIAMDLLETNDQKVSWVCGGEDNVTAPFDSLALAVHNPRKSLLAAAPAYLGNCGCISFPVYPGFTALSPRIHQMIHRRPLLGRLFAPAAFIVSVLASTFSCPICLELFNCLFAASRIDNTFASYEQVEEIHHSLNPLLNEILHNTDFFGQFLFSGPDRRRFNSRVISAALGSSNFIRATAPPFRCFQR